VVAAAILDCYDRLVAAIADSGGRMKAEPNVTGLGLCLWLHPPEPILHACVMRSLVLAAVLALPLACSSSNPTPDDTVGDGDGDMGDGDASGDGDGDEQPADLPAAVLDVPADGIAGCCVCLAVPMCETDIAGSESPEACEVYGEQWDTPSEWHADCYPDPSWGIVCPGSCAG